MRKRALIAVAIMSVGLCSCGQLVKVASQGGEAAVKAGGQVVSEAGQAASKAAGEAGQHLDKAGQELGKAGQELGKAGQQVGQSVENATNAGVDVATDLLTNAGDLFSATTDQITDYSAAKQAEFQNTSDQLKGQFEALKPTLSPQVVTEMEGRFQSLDEKVKAAGTLATVASLQAVQAEGSELVTRLRELRPAQATPTASGTPAAANATASPLAQ
jgi:hypothetical protein